MRCLIVVALLAPALAAQTGAQVRESILKALPPLQNSASAFVAKRACVSCHHNVLPILAFHMASERGVPVDSKVLSAVEQKTFRELRSPTALDDAIKAATLNDPTPDDSYLLMAAHAAGLPMDLTKAVYANRLASWQRDGHWVTSDFRPPHSSSLFTATATAVRAIALYMPEELMVEREVCLAKARRWLAATRPQSTEDATFRLLGLLWAGAPEVELSAASRDLFAFADSAGGWPELHGYPRDAYSTGEALFALHEAGMPVSDRVWRAGLRFLLSTQAADGTWHVRTRMISPAQVSPDYFNTGFPYKKDEFLSYAGSIRAVMAMLETLPAHRRLPSPAVSAAEPWIRTALFGTAQQLAALLKNGLDPNSETKNGTTLLMMAAPDAGKVRLLLAKGAKATGPALTIAASYRNTSESLKALLEAGAPVKGGKRSALVFASMAGDLANVKLLLEHSAEPNAALSDAVTFGYPEIVRALLDAGASAGGTEASGINLLHWAVITNHPAVIPALIEAGVPLNSTDEFGFTPLMYAATIDFGDTGSVPALLKAGADPAIRNKEGRSPLEQARYYHHTAIEAALR